MIGEKDSVKRVNVRRVEHGGWSHTISTPVNRCCVGDGVLIATLAVGMARLERDVEQIRQGLQGRHGGYASIPMFNEDP